VTLSRGVAGVAATVAATPRECGAKRGALTPLRGSATPRLLARCGRRSRGEAWRERHGQKGEAFGPGDKDVGGSPTVRGPLRGPRVFARALVCLRRIAFGTPARRL
jgi:hypothetical protein